MIHLIDRALERYLRRQVPLPESSIGVSFEPPDKTWGAALNRPTVNAFLWNLTPASSSSMGGMLRRDGPGGTERRPLSPTIEFHYLITAWASELRDEHQLLGDVLQTVLTEREISEDLIPPGAVTGRVSLSLSGSDQSVPGEFWSALGGRLKPGLQLQVTAPVDVYPWNETARPPETVEVAVDTVETVEAGAGPRSRVRWSPAEPGPSGGIRRVRSTVVEHIPGAGSAPTPD